MSDYPTSWDPYAPPQAQQVPVARGPLPTGLKAVCIIAIVLGGLGTLFSCGGAASLAIGPSIRAAFGTPAQPGIDQESARMQRELQAEMAAIGQEYLPFTIASVILHLFSGLALLCGGILALKLSATGRSILLVGCVLAILYELVDGVLNVVIQLRTVPLAQKMMDQVLQQGGQAELPPAFGQFMLVIMFVTLGISLVTVVVKIAFYVMSVVYLKKPHIVAYFAS
jgi:hypothetical protein